MKNLLLLASVLISSTAAHAAAVSASLDGFSGLLKNGTSFEQVHVAITPEGKIGVSGSKIASQDPVEATVVRDDRPMDGNLVLQINKNIQLIVSSGETRDGTIEYQLKVGAQTIPLKASVNLSLKSEVSLLPTKEFVCQKGWIDCMPGMGEPNKYCSQEYSDFAEKHCGGRPQIAQ